jgi:hypothetical protein
MITSIMLPSIALRWVLSGPAGNGVDTLVASLIGAGVTVESIKAGERYRLAGPTETLEVLASELAAIENFDLAREMPPTETISMASTVAPSHAYRRSMTVHGVGAATGFVARAVDRHLTVTPCGVNRWSVAGRTAALVDWLAEVWSKPADEVLAVFGLTPEAVAAEDSPIPTVHVVLPPVPVQVNVTLPDRRTTSDFKRDAEGTVTTVVQLETSV